MKRMIKKLFVIFTAVCMLTGCGSGKVYSSAYTLYNADETIFSEFFEKKNDEWLDAVVCWADMTVVDGEFTQLNVKEGYSVSFPIDVDCIQFMELDNNTLGFADLEFNAMGIRDAESQFVVWYATSVPGALAIDPGDDYLMVTSGYFNVWYKEDFGKENAQRILDSCVAMNGDELNKKLDTLEAMAH